MGSKNVNTSTVDLHKLSGERTFVVKCGEVLKRYNISVNKSMCTSKVTAFHKE
jgi:hypothetical protein